MAREPPASARLGGVPAVARPARRAAGSARGLRHRGAAPLRVRLRVAVRQGRRRHRAGQAAQGTFRRGGRWAGEPSDRRPREGCTRGLHVREHRLPGGARGVRRVRDARSLEVRRLVWVLVAAAVLAGVAVYVVETTPNWFERIRYPLSYSEYIRVHAREHDLDPALMAAVIYQESKFRPDARSSSGAIGLMQLTPTTAHGIAIRTHGSAFQTSDLYNPEINIRYGAWYLHDLFAKYHSERLVLAAYNAGQGNVDRWRAAGEGIQFSETRAYVARVEHLQHIYSTAW